MKKIIALSLTLVLILGAFAGCSKKKDDSIIRIGASSTPHAEILRVVEEQLRQKGYTLDIKEFDDYVLPNTSLEDGELDANYFQHQPYLDEFNEERGTHIVSVATIHFEPFGLYAGKSSDFANIQDGASIAVPNDTSNEARALLLLEAEGLIKLDPNAGFKATVKDITENPKNIQIVELEAAQLGRSLQDVDFAIINGNYAIKAGLSVANALVLEDPESIGAITYGNVLCVKEGNENNAGILALVEALKSDEVRNYIEATYGGAVRPLF